jgi:KaiC/GvpD/RAD55 family RecA-like ATPase
MPSDIPLMGTKAGLASKAGVASTGIEKLDLMLDGGFRESSNILLIGPPGIEKAVFGLCFVSAGIREGISSLYVTIDMLPSELERKAEKYGLDISSHTNKELQFIDCYSWTLGKKETERSDTQVAGPSALNDLSIAMNGLLQKNKSSGLKTRIVVHSLSTLLLYNSPEPIYQFLQITGARLKSLDGTTIFYLDSGMHDDKVVATLRHLADIVVELTFKKDEWFLSIADSPLPGPVEFRIGAEGIELM